MKKSRLRLLWIEDSADDIDLFALALKRSGLDVQVEIKTDGQAGLDYLRHEAVSPPDVILLDLNLPKKSGRQVLEEIKKSEHLQAIPVVVLTTSNVEPDIIHCYRSGASCYLVKPEAFGQLVELIKTFCAFWQHVEFPVPAAESRPPP